MSQQHISNGSVESDSDKTFTEIITLTGLLECISGQGRIPFGVQPAHESLVPMNSGQEHLYMCAGEFKTTSRLSFFLSFLGGEDPTKSLDYLVLSNGVLALEL